VDETPLLTVGQASIALAYMLSSGGSGYLPRRMVAAHVAAGRLHPVPDAPRFTRSVDVIVRSGLSERPWFGPWVEELRRLAHA